MTCGRPQSASTGRRTSSPGRRGRPQARSNLLVNDEGYNLPPGSPFNSITTALNDEAQIAFPIQVATYPGSPSTSTAALWLGQGGEGDLVHRLPVNAPISPSVHINEAGDEAFAAGEATSNTVFLYDAALEQAGQINTMPVTTGRTPSPVVLGGASAVSQNVIDELVALRGQD